MQKPLFGEKIAVLVANGFEEQDLTQAQKILRAQGADLRIVSMDNGLVNSWAENGWGLNFAADAVLSEALGADYSMLLVPGGQRSIEKLKLTAHTRRFINSFLNANKPTVMFDDAADLLVFANKGAEYEVAASERVKDNLVSAGARWCEDSFCIDGVLMTGRSDSQTRAAFCEALAGFLANPETGTDDAIAA